MAPSSTRILEQCQISPPPGSSPPSPTSLPLTFFDIPWLLFSPSQPLFFYNFRYTSTHFTTTTLPALKHSLSLTLRHFHPLAGNLSTPPPPSKPEIVYTDGDFVSLTVTESNADFNHISANHLRDANEFYQLVPTLPSTVFQEKLLVHLLAVKITVFGELGLCIGLAFHHVVADERTFNLFMKSWASICKSLLEGDSSASIKSLPSYDRTVIIETNGLQTKLLKQWWDRNVSRKNDSIVNNINILETDRVRATFVLTPTDMERIKRWIIAETDQRNLPKPLALSAYILTCAFAWVCLNKAQEAGKHGDEEPIYLGFMAGGITRLNYRVPTTYFGNCVAFGRSTAMRKDLEGENGIVIAAKAIGDTIKELNREVLGGAERWISEWEEVLESELHHLMVVGSPKVDLYEMEFGWGRPKKIEDISIDGIRAISLTESRELKGGIEIGLVLPKAKMDAFSSLFSDGLRNLP